MRLNKEHVRSFCWILIGSIFLLILQSVWIYHTYRLEYDKLRSDLEEAFSQAYQKEQAYRIPVVDIVDLGEVSMQSCGNEEIIIVRKCFDSDTIVYNNTSGHSIEKFINRVFLDLREQIIPINIYCLSDLFAGMLHDKNIPLSFIIERYSIDTGEVLETSAFPDEQPQIHTKYEYSIVLDISDMEAIRAILQISPQIVFRNMTVPLIFTLFLVGLVILCMVFLWRIAKRSNETEQSKDFTESIENSTFHIGRYDFNPSKNELQGFGEIVQLNKKENSILYALCLQQGNVVERKDLLEENWGSSGIIYSRSLDTYLATLRKYLKKDTEVQIITVKGVGYKLVCMKNS